MKPLNECTFIHLFHKCILSSRYCCGCSGYICEQNKGLCPMEIHSCYEGSQKEQMITNRYNMHINYIISMLVIYCYVIKPLKLGGLNKSNIVTTHDSGGQLGSAEQFFCSTYRHWCHGYLGAPGNACPRWRSLMDAGGCKLAGRAKLGLLSRGICWVRLELPRERSLGSSGDHLLASFPGGRKLKLPVLFKV